MLVMLCPDHNRSHGARITQITIQISYAKLAEIPNMIQKKHTTSKALIVVSSRLAAKQPSSGEPPSHKP